MQQFIVSVYNNMSDEVYAELLEQELAYSKELKTTGQLLKVYVKAEHRGAILIMQAENDSTLKALLREFPFYPYWYKIEIDLMRVAL